VYVIDRRAQRQQSRDNRARTGAENQVEFFMERAAAQSLNFLENAQGIETLSAATV